MHAGVQVRAAAAQARVHLCGPTLDDILSSATNLQPHTTPTVPSTHVGDAVMHHDTVLPEDEASNEASNSASSIKSQDGSFCCQAQAAALYTAAHRLSALHAAHVVAVGRKRSATAAGLQLTEDGEPPEVAVASLSPILSMHAVPALRHEAFKALNASAGQEPSLIRLVAAASSDVTASGLATRASFWPLPQSGCIHQELLLPHIDIESSADLPLPLYTIFYSHCWSLFVCNCSACGFTLAADLAFGVTW